MDRRQRSGELDRWLGKLVFIRYMGSSDPSKEHIEQMGEDQNFTLTGPLQVVQHLALLETYDQFGIKVRSPVEESRPFFLPWGAVLYIYSSPEAEQGQPPGQDQQEGTEETVPSPDRQELMDLLASAETQPQVAVAKAAADSYLATHPSDGDVRMAREQLEARFPADSE